MLTELAQHDKEWHIMALSICKDKYIAGDLVNEMYIKIYDSNKKWTEINKWYIWVTMKHLYYDILKLESKTVSIDYFYNIEDLQGDNDVLEARKKINEALNELGFFDREILLHTHERSLRDNQEYLGINYRSLHYSKHNALKKLKETKTIKNLSA